MLKSTLLLPLLAIFASATVHNVQVGKNVGGNALRFFPDMVKAVKGDTVNFHFYEGDHAVAQSTYSGVCKVHGDIFSGFFGQAKGIAKTMFVVPINNTDPVWLYCPTFGHCQAGMAMVINPAKGQSLETYQEKSRNTESSGVPKKVGGGHFEPNKG